MCGIVGYTGKQSVAKQILDALELLEYRGYDSAGMAIVDETNGQVQIRKRAGRVADLEKVWKANLVNGICGIGHTRWATHGGVSDVNAHPHRAGRVTLVHNGIIENYEELKDHFGLADELISDTDSEVVAAVLNRFYTGDPHEALFQTVKCLKGTFALVVIFDDIPDVIFAIRNVSPIVAAYREDGTMLASDVAALGGQATSYMVVPEYHVVELHTDDIRVYNMKNELCEAEFLDIDWDTTRAGKGNYPFYMEKEIMEQPEAIKATLAPRYVDGRISLEADGVPDDVLKNCERVCVVACGTAMHAGLVAQSLVRSILRMHMEVEYASEFMYMDPVIDDKTLVLAISQSGETIDTLEALKYARSQGAKSIAVINVKGSSIARESDYVMYTYAGPEIAVASTKAYTTQIAALFALIGRMAVVRGAFNEEQEKSFVDALMQAPDAIQKVLDRKEEMHHIARGLLEAKDAFMLGRGLDYAILLEGALKLKEVSYIHTEAYASGELKHGTISLIEDGTLVIGVLTQDELYEKTISNMVECKSRGAYLMGLTTYGNYTVEDTAEFTVYVPKTDAHFMASLAVVPLQMLGYYVSVAKGLDVDKPRNLAKSVTVE